jgi:hypothetical protein
VVAGWIVRNRRSATDRLRHGFLGAAGSSDALIVVGDDGPVRITMLGPLAVDGQPVRGERLATVIRELV